MKLKKIGNNETELIFNDGTHVLFSYETPVAVSTTDKIFVTEQKYSNTTTKHINKWCHDSKWCRSYSSGYLLEITTVPQHTIDTFLVSSTAQKGI